MLSDRNRGRRTDQPYVAVIALDRWGRVLVTRGPHDVTWSLPGGAVAPGESADAAALRAFEEEAGHLLEELRFFGIFRDDSEQPEPEPSELQVYYCDPDLDVELLGVDEEREFRYLMTGEVATISLAKAIRQIIEQFLQSTHYRAMFH